MKLAAVLNSQPSHSSGKLTLERVGMAGEILGAKNVSVCNLFGLATRSVLDVSSLGTDEHGWTQARSSILVSLDDATDVLLAFGVQEPTGKARSFFRAQIEWLGEMVADRGLRTWTVGGSPRHPSRWQRYTVRSFPDLSFADALAQSFKPGDENATEEPQKPSPGKTIDQLGGGGQHGSKGATSLVRSYPNPDGHA